MELLSHAMDVFLHLDAHLDAWLAAYGLWLYSILFLVIFCETGLVVTPFLPGDSLLFAVGALIARPDSPLDLLTMIVLLVIAGVLGDAVNYAIGYRIGPKVFSRQDSVLLNRQHLLRAQDFYNKYGGKTIVFARFMPIVRTFAPFVAGIGKMAYPRFALFNVLGAVSWVLSFSVAGYFFGNLPMVKKNFQYVILVIIVLSVLPAAWEYWKERRTGTSA